ncbi:restriction endonuclease subunit S, partial [Thiolapillus sp.]
GSLYIRPNKTGVFSDYINRLISGSTIKAWLESESQGATLPNLNKKIVSNIKVPVPSDDTLERFSEIIIKIERIRDVITSCSNEPLFQSVSQRAFRGKL